MLNPDDDRAILVQRLREFADGRCGFDRVERVAFEIRDRWSRSPESARPPESEAELPLWAAVWDITSSCKDSLIAEPGREHPVLQHIVFLEGSAELPIGWRAERP